MSINNTIILELINKINLALDVLDNKIKLLLNPITSEPVKNEMKETKEKKEKYSKSGGATAVLNGSNYEELTNLPNLFKIEFTKCKFGKGKTDIHYTFTINNIQYRILYKNGFHKFLKKEFNTVHENKLEPDEAILDERNKIIYIIEKKFQTRTGSVDEKLQTGVCKKDFYTDQFLNYKIIFIYTLSDWFKQKKYNWVIKYLEINKIHVLFGSDIEYQSKIIKIISNY